MEYEYPDGPWLYAGAAISPRLHRFPLGTPVPPAVQKHMDRLDCVGVNSVTGWHPVQGVSRLRTLCRDPVWDKHYGRSVNKRPNICLK